jgi:NAD-dependent deacetylase
MPTPFEEAADILLNGTKIIAVTGAGVSVESGIPDFRSPNGIWATYPPDEFATIDAFLADPDKVWAMWYELGASLGDVQPNSAHRALAQLEHLGRLDVVITQNIDNLHTAAGNTNVIEYHGNASKTICLTCGERRDLDLTHRPHGAPRCACGGVMKPDIVFFGEMIPEDAVTQSDLYASTCDVVLIIGTSATVYPAAAIPYEARGHGARIIECNTERTDFTDTITDIFLQGPAGETLPKLMEALK